MRARDIMTSPVLTVRSDAAVAETAALLAGRGFPALPVVDADSRLLGMVTVADLADLTGQAGLTVAAVQSAPASVLGPDADLIDLTKALLTPGPTPGLAPARVSVPIVEDGRVIGIVTRADLHRVVGRDDATIARDVAHRLAEYSGHDRWRVEVRAGEVTIGCPTGFADETDRVVVAALAEAVPGVVRARTVAAQPG